jgi:hypothetical protein
MHMTIREYRVPANQVDEVARRVDEDWVDKIRAMPGFVSYHVVKARADQLVSLAAFLDEGSGRKAAEASAEWVGAWLMDLDVEFLDMRQGPVVAHAGP